MSNLSKCIGLHGSGLDLARLKGEARKSGYGAAAQKHLDEYQAKLDEAHALVQPVKTKVEPSQFEVVELTAAKQALDGLDIDREVQFKNIDGDIEVTSIKKLLDETEAEMKELPLIEQATRAAITCFLKFGDTL